MRALAVVLLASCTVPPSTTESQMQPLGPRCVTGETRGCSCLAASGFETCVAPNGVWSTCGCTSKVGSDVVVPPAPPPVSQCGGVQCTPYTEEDSEVGAKACCTTSNACGSSSHFLFGDQCLPRGAPAGSADGGCPSESGNFIDLEGCCRPDGYCGLSIDTVPNFDLGCIERTQMAQWLNAGSMDRDNLSRLFFLPVKAASFPSMRCTP